MFIVPWHMVEWNSEQYKWFCNTFWRRITTLILSQWPGKSFLCTWKFQEAASASAASLASRRRGKRHGARGRQQVHFDAGTSLLRCSTEQVQQQCEQTRGEAAGGSTEATKDTRWRWWRGSQWGRVVVCSREENRGGQEVPGLLAHEQVHQLCPPWSRRSTQVHLLDTQSVGTTWSRTWRWTKVLLHTLMLIHLSNELEW